MFIAMKSVAVNIFFIIVVEQSSCDYQDRSQDTYLKNMMCRGYGERNPYQVCRVGKNHGVSFELLRRNLLFIFNWE